MLRLNVSRAKAQSRTNSLASLETGPTKFVFYTLTGHVCEISLARLRSVRGRRIWIWSLNGHKYPGPLQHRGHPYSSKKEDLRHEGSFEWFCRVIDEVAEKDRIGTIELHNCCTNMYEEGDACSALVVMLQSYLLITTSCNLNNYVRLALLAATTTSPRSHLVPFQVHYTTFYRSPEETRCTYQNLQTSKRLTTDPPRHASPLVPIPESFWSLPSPYKGRKPAPPSSATPKPHQKFCDLSLSLSYPTAQEIPCLFQFLWCVLFEIMDLLLSMSILTSAADISREKAKAQEWMNAWVGRHDGNKGQSAPAAEQPQQGRPWCAPEFDGVNCFETIVSH
ncbi:hypothetical protein Taro_040514 [Colocasia esculenta]|uniref:Ferric reductase NAD binding domain-containing protein n=1 Tax=Colocasia esculenta TaxID=4460 RepID=A0A843WQM6_COLES|nr:hypothetical protein [Colocasia esculenta]